MQIEGLGLRKQGTYVRYQSQQDALKFLEKLLLDDRGIALLHGPVSSGKTVVATEFVRRVQSKLAVAAIDGSHLNTTDLLSRVLHQFGYDVELESVDELVSLINVFAVQQTRANQSPLLIVENVGEMFPGALAALARLADLKAGDRYALRMVLISGDRLSAVIGSPKLIAVANRLIGRFELGPMTSKEALHYLYAKLRAAGVERPDDIFSVEVCEKLHRLSGGWPGDMDDMAQSIMQQAERFPIRAVDIIDPDESRNDDVPSLIVTPMGGLPSEVRLTEKRALIGRSDLSDIVVKDQFVSNQHALLIRDKQAVVLVDLKSRNGTFVNSRRVQSKVLLHDDIVSLGGHRMKMVYPPGHPSIHIDDAELADTAKMKNIAAARKAREQQIPTLVAVANRKDKS